jgi:hypothetical protein
MLRISSPHPYTFSDPMFDFSVALPFLKLELPDSPPPLPALLPAATAAVLPVGSGLDRSLAILEANSHTVRLRHVRQVQGDKGTGDTYERCVNGYERWWSSDQLRQRELDPEWTLIPVFPVTPAKVAMFLEHEITHEKVFFFPLHPDLCFESDTQFCGRKRVVAPTPFLVQQSESRSSRVPSLHSKIGASTITTSTKTSPRPRSASGATTVSEPLNLQPRTTSRAVWTPLKPSRRPEAHQVGAAHNVVPRHLL